MLTVPHKVLKFAPNVIISPFLYIRIRLFWQLNETYASWQMFQRAVAYNENAMER